MLSAQQQLHNNTVYPLLNRFLKEGWITQRVAEGERGQTRLVYELTAEGRRYLAGRLAQFTEAEAGNDDAFRLRVGLFDLLGIGARGRILELRDRRLAEQLERMRQIAAAHKTMSSWPKETFDFTVASLEREREWIAGLLSRLES